MKLKRLFLGAGIAILGVSLASCSEKEIRNTTTPYGALYNQLDKEIATANNGKSKMTVGTYYNKLKSLGYDKVSTAINSRLYEPEIKALKALLTKENLNDYKDALTIKIEGKDGASLYELTEEKIAELRRELLEEINLVIATKVYGTADFEAISKKTPMEMNKAIQSFIDSQAKIGIFLEEADLKNYLIPTDSNYELNKEKKLIQFKKETLDKLEPAVDAVILEQAKLLSAKKALFQIAEKEYITKTVEENGKDVEKTVKNDYYIFKDSNYKSEYERTFKTYGTYNAIVIQFNSLKEAQAALKANPIDTSSLENAKKSYANLYNMYYKYKTPANTSADDPIHIYEVNEFKDDFADLPASVSTLIKSTLKDDEYLTEPRNVNNKYVLAFRGKTVYSVSEDKDETDYNDLTEAQKDKYLPKIKEALIDSNAKSYQATDYQKKLEDAKLKIYDPYFEYKFEYENASFYDHVTEVTKPESNLIFEMEGSSAYTVDQFFVDASDSYASSILVDYFQLDYANQYYNDYVDLHLINKDAKKDNKKALDEAIKAFNSNKNSTYPAEIGLETFLIANYGYANKDEVLKYYYDAKSALTTYKSIVVFDQWATEDHKINTEKTNILNNILETGNKTYNDIFNINLDHLLINIDDNGDGQPDDPDDFFQKNPSIKADFEQAVANLAQAIYTEAVNEAYKNNTLFETLTYIKSQYEEGGAILSQPGKTWDDFKNDDKNGHFNFLLTVEQLASNGDITQDSVNNFVTPFKDYVKNIYKTASNNKDLPKEFDNGTFYIVSGSGESLTGEQLTTPEQATKITNETLCKTNFGYHLLVLNSFSGPKSTKYTENDDAGGFQKDLQIVLRKYEDADNQDKNEIVYINTSSYNQNDNQASFEQLFIYYVQQANGVDSSLDSDVKQIMSSLFDNAISTYKSSNFQTFLLLRLLNVQINDLALFSATDSVNKDYKINTKAVSAEIENLKNQIISYDQNSPYVAWVTDMDWTRPDSK